MASGEVPLPNIPVRRDRYSLLRRLLRTRLAGFGLFLVVMFAVMALGANLIAPGNPQQQHLEDVFQPPSAQHIFGTDNLGRDIFGRLVHGSRVSLTIGLGAIAFAAGIGILMGLLAGYTGGWRDTLLMSVTDAMWSFPALVLALAITGILGAGIPNLILAIGIVYTPAFVRLIRSQTLAVKEFEYISAARTIGAGQGRIAVQHILPNVLAPVIVQASLSVPLVIIVEASLSFIGIGVDITVPTWGGMLRTGYQYLQRAPWVAFAPGMAIFLAALGFNLLGDGLRTALDPRLRRMVDGR
ncbi:MAG: ABC transporter permease [Dehalococcoidia bacterium]